MDLNSLNTDAPFSALTVILFSMALVSFFVLIFSKKIAAKRSDVPDLKSMILTFGLISAVFTAAMGMVSVGSENYRVENNSFHERLASDYGLHTEDTLYSVKKDAVEGNILKMSNDAGDAYVRPHLDGEKLTFTKVTKEEPINPRK